MSNSIKSAALAIEKCRQYTAFFSHATNVTVERVLMPSVEIPFLSQKFTNVWVWRCIFDLGYLALKSSIPEFVDQYERRCEVLISEKDGLLLTISAKSNFKLPSVSLAYHERQLSNIGEQYTDLPSAIPSVTALDAIDSILAIGGPSAYYAKQIDMLCVKHSRSSAHPSVVWMVMLSGIPRCDPIGVKGNTTSAPDWHFDHLRCAVDASSGACLFITNVPHPDIF